MLSLIVLGVNKIQYQIIPIYQIYKEIIAIFEPTLEYNPTTIGINVKCSY